MMKKISSLLVIFFLFAGATVPLLVSAAGEPPCMNNIALIKQRLYQRYLINSPGSKESVAWLLQSLQADGSWTEYNYDERPKLGLAAIGHLHRLVGMCNAYRSADSALYKDNVLKEKIHLALNLWFDKDPETDHHWFNEIGAPRELAKILIWLEDELSGEELKKGIRILYKAHRNGVFMYGTHKATGQNMIWVARIQMEAGCLQNDTAYVRRSLNEIEEEIVVTRREGIQPDWSFHQHGPQLYSGGYGVSFTRDCAELATLVVNTSYAFPSEKISVLSNHILEGQQWMTRGRVMDYGAEGRELARMDKDATSIAFACDDMALLNTERRAEFLAYSKRIKGTASIEEGPQGNRHYYRSDFMVHRRPAYYASVKMVSSRVNGSETGNGEANFNFHTPDGLTYIIKTGDEYRNIFPLWNWRKLPGVTCRQNNIPLPLMTFGRNSSGKTNFVGGVSDGQYGMAAFDYNKDSVQARKAWFYFDKEIVCLGAGITSTTSGDSVITAVNQCFSKRDAVVSNEKKGISLNEKGWVYHDGTAYLFPGNTIVNGNIEKRTAGWRVVNTFANTTRTETGNVFTLWIDHGVNPSNAAYSYIIIPQIKKEAVAKEAASKNISILSNTRALQAVKNNDLGIVQIAFYQAGRLSIDASAILEVDKPCLVMVKQTTSSQSITVSNPENKALTVQVKLIKKGSVTIQPVFELPGGDHAGQSITQHFTTK